MVSHHSTKFDGHKHYGGGYIMLLVVKLQDYTRSLKFNITIYL